jgi:hypothetical protein
LNEARNDAGQVGLTVKKAIRYWVRQEWQRVGQKYQSQDAFAQTYAELVPKRYRDVTYKPVHLEVSEILDWLVDDAPEARLPASL